MIKSEVYLSGQTSGHLPPLILMPTGINEEKKKVRELNARGEVDDDPQEMESTIAREPAFYGTANTNQMLMELMGLHVPGASFVPPNCDRTN